MRILSSAASGMRAQQVALDTLGNNIANVNTPGFKAERTEFAQALASEIRVADDNAGITNSGIGSGVLYNGITANFKQGNLASTDNPLDLGIDGEGFFQVALPEGRIGYTRAGAFKLDASGNLSDAQGNLLLGREVDNDQAEIGPIRVPVGTTGVTVDASGQLTGLVDGQKQNLGQIILVAFENPQGFMKVGDSIYVQTANSGEPVVGSPGTQTGTLALGTIRPKSLEQSNVDLGRTMTDLIQVQRAYQMNSRMIQNGEQMWSLANSLRR